MLRYDGGTGAFLDVYISAMAGISGPTDLIFALPPVTPGDLDGDGVVGIQDLLQLLATWGPCASCAEDLDADGDVDINDLLILLASWS